MKEKISIQREDVLNAYRKASEEQKALLENMFGKDMFKSIVVYQILTLILHKTLLPTLNSALYAQHLTMVGSLHSPMTSTAFILGSTSIPKMDTRNSMRMRRKSVVSLVGRVTMRMRFAVSFFRVRTFRHRTRIRITVL